MCYNNAGDDTYPAEDSLEMYAHVHEEGAGMVIGCRLSSTYFQQDKIHNFSNSIVRTLINRIFGADVRDIMTRLQRRRQSIKHKERREFEFRLHEISRWQIEAGASS